MKITGLIFLTMLIERCIAIKCYKCAVAVEKVYVNHTTITIPTCSKFDRSDEYIVECPFSTMCLKTISILHLQSDQVQETITRGCAQQKDTTQVFQNRQWQQKHSVQEVYTEGCGEFKDENFVLSGKTYCYCRGELCNAASAKIVYTLLLFLCLFFSL